ncbi:hypothetical protein HDU92_005168 [Lobulomyces angularis]|nr:hypothetical protein HDU92_005168 [Lobulomyces angularis]
MLASTTSLTQVSPIDKEFNLWSPPTPTPLHCSSHLISKPKRHSQRAQYAEKILDQATNILSVLYPTSTKTFANKPLASLKTFIRDFLKKSKTTFSTLQLALLYLVNLKKAQEKLDFLQNDKLRSNPIFKCGRRMFLASLVIASKVVLEPAPKNIAWSKLSGLPISEINNGERLLLTALNYRVVVPFDEFVEWNMLLHCPTVELFHKINLVETSSLDFVQQTVHHNAQSKMKFMKKKGKDGFIETKKLQQSKFKKTSIQDLKPRKSTQNIIVTKNKKLGKFFKPTNVEEINAKTFSNYEDLFPIEEKEEENLTAVKTEIEDIKENLNFEISIEIGKTETDVKKKWEEADNVQEIKDKDVALVLNQIPFAELSNILRQIDFHRLIVT